MGYIREKISQKVIILGGTASGKTEYLSEYINHFGAHGGIFFDGTLPSFAGAKIKIEKALKYQREVEIYFVIPKNLQNFFVAFTSRERISY